MMKVAKGKKIVVFLDYDGTLSPIMRAAVREVAKCFPTAIISGRSREKVKEFVQLSNVYYAGSHGMDIMAPPRPVKSCEGNTPTVVMDKKGTEVLFQPILTELEEETAKIKGAMVEDNRFCVSVHFRHVKDEVKHHHLLVKKLSVQKQNSSLINSKAQVMEIRPTIEWDKGHAVEYFLETLGLSNSDVLPVYIGEDRTDEDAFKVLINQSH
ncbi:unnamed protein product [Linum tenue]|uniref:Trehalose 6-phosphate phosphatase n=1 Tax=Linum tenue TaxID=586396 RepID=A0AAV0QR45_9ROSI|nr:unnamed protein product [Linum tenue]